MGEKMARLQDKIPERHLDPLAAPSNWVMRRLDARNEADTRRRLRALERRGGGGGAPAIEELAEDDDLDPADADPNRIYRRRGGSRVRDRITVSQQQSDDVVRWIEPFTSSDLSVGPPPFHEEFFNHRAWGTANTGTGSIVPGTAWQHHPGIQTLGTGATINSTSRIYLTENEGSPAQLFLNDFEMTWIVHPDVALTNVIYRLGVATDWSAAANMAATSAADWFGFEYDTINTSDTEWHFITRNAGSETDAASGVTVSTSYWFRLTMRFTRPETIVAFSAANIELGTAAAFETASNVTTSTLNPGAGIRTGNAANKEIGLDSFSFQSIGLSR